MLKRMLGAIALALVAAAPALADPVQLPQVKNAAGNYVPSQGVVCVSADGTACSFGSSAPANQRVNAQAGDFAAGSIADLGTGAIPGPYTLNGRLSTGNGYLGTIAGAIGTPGGTLPSSALLMMGSDGTYGRALRTDALGALILGGSSSVIGVTYSVGSIAAGATDSGNPVKTGCYASGTTPSTVTAGQRANSWCGLNGQTAAMPTDASGNILAGPSNTDTSGDVNGVRSVSYPLVYNGSTWARQRDANSANATTGTGLLGAGVLGKYNATLPTYTDGQFGNLQINAKGNLIASVADSGGNGISSFNGGSDGLAITGQRLATSSFGLVFDGTTWDRARGDTTGGAYVQERERSSIGATAETTTALGAGASFTGANHTVGASGLSQWSTVSCGFLADQASATNGAQLLVSFNGTTFYIARQLTLTANTWADLTAPVYAPYAECKLTNGSTAQGSNLIAYRQGA